MDCGAWSQKAIGEARKYCDVHVCGRFTNAVVPSSQWKYRPDAGFIHVCMNETISGVEILSEPELPADAPILVADATSTLFSRPIDVSKYGCIYASAGKNFGPAGVCIVIVRDDLLKRKPSPYLPGILDLREAVNSKPIPSIYNTPPCFQIYMVDKVLRRAKRLGGLKEMERRAIGRSQKIYTIIDASKGFYYNDVAVDSRSRMNICFSIGKNVPDHEKLEALFVEKSEAAGMFQLFKHPLYGGLRITIYNGLEDAAVDCVQKYLIDFATAYGTKF